MNARLEKSKQTGKNISRLHVSPRAAVGQGHVLAERQIVILLTTVVFTLPLSLYRNIERLGKVRLPAVRWSTVVR